jgi:cell division protease FtsH
LEGQISTLYGGRIAEEIFAGEDYITTGASNDIERATLIATKMVTEWGMGTGLPPIKYVDEGGAFSSGSSFKSGIEEITTNVQKEIEKIIFKSYSNAEEILKTNWDKVIQISNLLMEFETIDSNQLKGIMEG